MKAAPLFTGVAVALITLFEEDGSLSPEATADLAAELVELGISAVVVAGTTGEASALSATERMDLFQAVRKVVPQGSGIPVIAGVGAPTTDQAVEFTAVARDAGADAALVLSLPDTTEQRPYYQAVASTAQGLPLLGYHFPRVSSPGIPVEALHDLPIVALKDSSGDAGRVVQTRAQWDRPLYLGSANLITMGGALGCAGMILGLANVMPEECIGAFHGDAAAQLRLAEPITTVEQDFPLSLKELVSARFRTPTGVRVR